MSTFSTIFNKISIYSGLGLVKPLSEPSAAARKRLWGRAPRMGQARGPGAAAKMVNYTHFLHIRSTKKIDRRGKGEAGGGGSKNRMLGNS